MKFSGLYSTVLGHRDALLAITIRLAAAAIGLAVVFVIGRNFGPEGNGVYGLVTQTALIASIFVVGGLDFVVLRRFAAARAEKQPVSRAGVGKVIVFVALPSLAISGLLLTLSLAPTRGLALAQVGPLALATVGVMIFARAMTRVTSAMLRAGDHTIMAQTVEALLIPALILMAFLVIDLASLDAVLFVTLVAGLCAAGLGIVESLRRATGPGGARLPWRLRSMYKEGLPLGAAALALGFADWYGLAVVAGYLGIEAAGVYRVAAQIATTIGIVATGLTSVYAAEISAAHALGDRGRMRRALKAASTLSIALTVPIAAGVLVAGRPLLGFIGPDFTSGFLTLLVLCAAQLAALVVSVAGVALVMTGHGRVHFPVTIGALGLLLVSAPLGASYAGGLGVAAAVGLSQLARVAAYLVLTRRLLEVNVITGRTVRSELRNG